jgi:hypothetical protein
MTNGNPRGGSRVVGRRIAGLCCLLSEVNAKSQEMYVVSPK